MSAATKRLWLFVGLSGLGVFCNVWITEHGPFPPIVTILVGAGSLAAYWGMGWHVGEVWHEWRKRKVTR